MQYSNQKPWKSIFSQFITAICAVVVMLMVGNIYYKFIITIKPVEKMNTVIEVAEKTSNNHFSNTLTESDKKIVENIIAINDKFIKDSYPTIEKIKTEKMSIYNEDNNMFSLRYVLDYNDKQNIRVAFSAGVNAVKNRKITIWNLNEAQCNYLFKHYSYIQKGSLRAGNFRYVKGKDVSNLKLDDIDNWGELNGIQPQEEPLQCDSFTKDNPNAAIDIYLALD